jgi:hypothetical protein
MSQLLAPPAYSETSEQLWNAWLARGVARERAMRRKLFFVALFLIVSALTAAAVWLR